MHQSRNKPCYLDPLEYLFPSTTATSSVKRGVQNGTTTQYWRYRVAELYVEPGIDDLRDTKTHGLRAYIVVVLTGSVSRILV